VTRASRPKPRYGLEPVIVHSFDVPPERDGGAAKVEPFQEARTPELRTKSSSEPLYAAQPSELAKAAYAFKPKPREAWAIRLLGKL
jgi:hypothetical protein